MSFKKRFFIQTLFLSLMANVAIPSLSLSAKPQANTIEGVAIVVNSDVITLSEWRDFLNQASRQYRGPKNAQFRNDVMNMLIVQKLQTQIASRNGIQISDQEVDSAVTDIAKRNNATVSQLQGYLAQMGQSMSDFKDGIRKQILASRVREGVTQGVRLTENEVDLFMQSQEFKNVLKNLSKVKIKQTNVSHILVRVSKDLTETAAKSRAQRLYERIIGGDDFNLLARAQSDDPVSAAKGGELGWVVPGQLVPEFEKVMNALPLNQLSQVVRSPFGFHIIKVHQRKEGAHSEEMIRNIAKNMLYQKKAAQAWAIWQDDLLNNAYIEKRIQ